MSKFSIQLPGYLELRKISFTTTKFPLFSEAVPCGFPSPAESHIKKRLSIQDIIKDKPSVFFLEAVGNSMIYCGIRTGTLLVCDKALNPKHNDIVLCTLNGKFMVKRFQHRADGSTFLKSETPSHPLIEIKEGDELLIEAVVTHAINEFI